VKFKCSLFAVEDIDLSRRFYEEILEQKVKYDFGENVTFYGDFAIQESNHYSNMIKIDRNEIIRKSNSCELYFETEDLDEAYIRLKESDFNIEFIHNIIEHPWGQRVIRFYDPNSIIIEVGESMESVVRRMNSQGYTLEEIVEKSQHPLEFVKNAIGI
jgi:catechol 2,3-dioxygenase-like lactoylglutathione lyase family enzyme